MELRFPDLEIENKSYSTADDQFGRPGDFLVNDTAFHITVAPMDPLYEKCKKNYEDGLRVFLLVPERNLDGARLHANEALPDKIAVQSIESFISQNIEELSEFSTDKIKSGFRRLLETYNKRVDLIENNKSFLIEIPKSLTPKSKKN